jgi:hypothetical protein
MTKRTATQATVASRRPGRWSRGVQITPDAARGGNVAAEDSAWWDEAVTEQNDADTDVPAP